MTGRSPTFTRRRFLLGASLLAAGVVAARWRPDTDVLRYYGRRVARPMRARASSVVNRVWSPARRIRGHFAYLRFAPGTVERFVADFESTIGPVPAWQSEVYMRFLMSTDFFRQGADQARVIGYATFYEPTVTPCYNPFSTFDRDDPARGA